MARRSGNDGKEAGSVATEAKFFWPTHTDEDFLLALSACEALWFETEADICAVVQASGLAAALKSTVAQLAHRWFASGFALK